PRCRRGDAEATLRRRPGASAESGGDGAAARSGAILAAPRGWPARAAGGVVGVVGRAGPRVGRRRRSGLGGGHRRPGRRAARRAGGSGLDRVLGGGWVPGSVTLLGGEPGIGKSTLLLQALAALAGSGARCLLVSAEESRQQVRLRAERLGALPASLWLVGETVLPSVIAHIEQVAPDVCVIDSIQTLHDPELGAAPGSVTQVREW